MNLVTQIAAVFMGVTLMTVFVLESFFYRRPELHPIFLIEPGQEATVRLWVVNQGFYNSFFGVAAIAGVVVCALALSYAAQMILMTTSRPTSRQSASSRTGYALTRG